MRNGRFTVVKRSPSRHRVSGPTATQTRPPFGLGYDPGWEASALTRVALVAVRVLQRQGGLASTSQPGNVGHRPRLLQAMPQLFDLLFASDDETIC